MADHSSYFPAFAPRMIPLISTQAYNGGYFTATHGWSGSLLTAVFLMKRAAFGGDTWEHLIRTHGSNQRLFSRVYSSAYSVASARNRASFSVRNSSGTLLVEIATETEVCDGNYWGILFSFNGSTGAVTLKVAGVDEDYLSYANRSAPITGTPNTGSDTVSIGASSSGGFPFGGELGHMGLADGVALVDWTKFFYPGNIPRAIDTAGWTEWGSAQPDYWNPLGDFRENLGNRTPSKTGSVLQGVTRQLPVWMAA